MKVTTVTNDGSGASSFSVREIELNGDSERQLSDQIPALNFRMRRSDSSYSSGFHVAGDPTLLIILEGTLRVELQNGETREFAKGEMFIAEDYLAPGEGFDETLHGHRAEVVGGDELSALHLKLEDST